MVLLLVQLNKIPVTQQHTIWQVKPQTQQKCREKSSKQSQKFCSSRGQQTLERAGDRWARDLLPGTWERRPGSALQCWLCPATCCNIFLIADSWSEYKPNREQMCAPKTQEDILAVSLFSLGEDLLRGSVQLRVVWGGVERQPLPRADSGLFTQHVKMMLVFL